METSAKRQRTEDEEKDREPESFSTPISPPRKKTREVNLISSPWQLTWIRDLPEGLNQDAVTLRDLLGDPLISECWEFNYLHDIDFLMGAFDPDTKHLVKVHVVHGFWKREDPQLHDLEVQARLYPNLQLRVAPMPEMFGTHHSKMMILFRHDDTAQVIIHTANMISKDWTNMTNAVWKSPLLPLATSPGAGAQASLNYHDLGVGEKFKADLLSYLKAYDQRRVTCKPLVDELKKYDFSHVKAALIASVPGKHAIHDQSQATWGWAALRRCLRTVPCQPGDAEIVAQISSIATLGATDSWLKGTMFSALSGSASSHAQQPKHKVVFPTVEEIRQSLDGYRSGASIHTKIQSKQQVKQLEYMRPVFHHWTNNIVKPDATNADAATEATPINGDSGRALAAPHIKTYIRYNNKIVDWAMLTSANLSKQAWGEGNQSSPQIRIASWEIGVLLWPELLEPRSIMVPSFQTDKPISPDWDHDGNSVIGLRMPYNMPLQRYGREETPWVATWTYAEPDRLGKSWGG